MDQNATTDRPNRPVTPNTVRSLDDPVQFVRGVGPGGAKLLAKLGLETVGDLLRHVPRRYEDRSSVKRIRDLTHGETALVCARVVSAETTSTQRRGIQLTRLLLADETGALEVVFFRQPYLLRRFQELIRRDQRVYVYGQVRRDGFGPPRIEHPEWEEEQVTADPLSSGRIVPVYPAGEGLTQRRLRGAVSNALGTHLGAIDGTLPEAIVERHGLRDVRTAYSEIHYPTSFAAMEAARHRLVFEEFFVLQTGLALRRRAHAVGRAGPPITYDADSLDQLVRSALPFRPTASQSRAIAEIARDLASGRPMNRLLHGDVGSGKTAVAVAALLLVTRAGYQVAVMAPTEILAQQHAIVLANWLAPLGLSVDVATGGRTRKSRLQTLARIASGDARVVVGTHALIEEDVAFARLGLAVIDEQHRFGVMQRQALRRKGQSPHVLVMSATPIPRTLTLTLYGDLDVTCLDELPPGRRPIRTHWKRPEQADAVYAGVAKLLDTGRQAYIVCPLVSESEKLEAAAATEHARRVSDELLPGYRIGLLHGQMRADEKSGIMEQMKNHEVDALVCTTVVEVGVDVPNASVIVVEDADRFGLAQLHQLRGRVGRGRHASYCVLIGDPKTPEGVERLRAMCETTDGFRIAEQDLRLRGPGEFFGTKQSGVPAFHFGDVLRDESTLLETREAAAQLVGSDPDLGRPEHAALRSAVGRAMAGLELVHVS